MHAKVHAAYMLRISREMKQHQANIMITMTKIDELPDRLANSKSSDSVGIGVGIGAAILECISLVVIRLFWWHHPREVMRNGSKKAHRRQIPTQSGLSDVLSARKPALQTMHHVKIKMLSSFLDRRLTRTMIPRNNRKVKA